MAREYMASHGVDLDSEMARIQFGQDVFKQAAGMLRHRQPPPTPTIAHLPGVLHAFERLVAPSLCHAHVHLDKCFLLQDPKYADLEIESGDFAEAMALTAKAKARFEEEDLLRRGRQLLEESIEHGVTAVRAFVEVDGQVRFRCLDAGLKLKKEFEQRCDVQICAFAQLPIFSGADGGDENRKLMAEAAAREGVDVLGSTPYVESDPYKMRMNVRWMATMTLAHKTHLDLHLDYNLDKTKEPLIWDVIDILKYWHWVERGGKGITLGHCTRLSMFKPDEWRRLKEEIGDLPLSFVGLPTSDLFMMRTECGARGTLPIPKMVEGHGLNAAIAVNNVGNAFTPQGSCDPLSVASLGVGVYQAGAKRDTEVLFECVSSRAKSSIGLECSSFDLNVGEPADFVIFEKNRTSWRTRMTIPEVVYDAGSGRQTIRGGLLMNRP
ncbi:cytosine deaminase protein-like protein [Lineolata rhizophorae]|uniref:Cytosine deaminase protein-like protein n=1 Tax=Lineolata rhizophorae TaxID=578093 RepID=A0A6A6P5G8_9PEZI|nr:cytosine deaminase protein-like protein [Lineolata rhizophorae]